MKPWVILATMLFGGAMLFPAGAAADICGSSGPTGALLDSGYYFYDFHQSTALTRTTPIPSPPSRTADRHLRPPPRRP